MAKEKEKCPRCGSEDFSIALGKDGKPDPKGKRYCVKCQHVWVQGLEAMTRPDVVLHQAQKEVQDLRKALADEREAAKVLKEKILAAQTVDDLEALKAPIAAQKAKDEEEIFS